MQQDGREGHSWGMIANPDPVGKGCGYHTQKGAHQKTIQCAPDKKAHEYPQGKLLKRVFSKWNWMLVCITLHGLFPIHNPIYIKTEKEKFFKKFYKGKMIKREFNKKFRGLNGEL